MLATARRQIWKTLTWESGTAGKVCGVLLALIIIVNVLAVMLETVKGFRQEHGLVLLWVERVSLVIFTVEYALRIWVAPEGREQGDTSWQARRGYMSSFVGIIDFFAAIPAAVLLFVGANVDLRWVRILRLMQLFKMMRYSKAMSTLWAVVYDGRWTLAASMAILFLLLIVSSTVIYYMERNGGHEEFTSIPAAMWWAVITLTTVGYGDVAPKTPVGRVFSAFIAVLGVGMFAIATGILASGFSANLRRRNKYKKEKAEFLEAIREKTNLSEEQIKEIEEAVNAPSGKQAERRATPTSAPD